MKIPRRIIEGADRSVKIHSHGNEVDLRPKASNFQ